MTVELVFCAGWDPVTRSIVRPLSAATAHERDAAGEPYAAALTAGGEDGPPIALVEVCWAAHHAAVWFFDEQGRRDRRLVFRRWPDDRLVLRTAHQWAYGPDGPERHDDWRVPCWRARYEPDGSRTVSTGDWTGPGLEVPTWFPVPAFGDWSAVVGDVGPVTPRPDPDPAAGEPLDELPWHPPEPLRPRGLDETFRAGARFVLDDGSEVTVELAPGGRLRLPTGRLVVADPAPWMTEAAPFVAAVPPGEYPLQLSVVRFVDNLEHARVAACALWVSDRPTATWNNAWREGEVPLLLGDGEFFGVGVDGGRVALVDAGAAPVFADAVEDAYEDMTGQVHELTAARDNLITVESGWGDGSYPVWIGRDEAGQVTCFVVDFLVLAQATQVG